MALILEFTKNENGVPGSHMGSVIAEQMPGSFSAESWKAWCTAIAHAPTSFWHVSGYCLLLSLHCPLRYLRDPFEIGFFQWITSLSWVVVRPVCWSLWGPASEWLDTQETRAPSRGPALTMKLNGSRAPVLGKLFKLAFYQLRGCEVTFGQESSKNESHSIWNG